MNVALGTIGGDLPTSFRLAMVVSAALRVAWATISAVGLERRRDEPQAAPSAVGGAAG